MSDDRPQYGEYASPEDQRRLSGLPPLDPATADLPPAGFGPVPPAAPAAAPTPTPTAAGGRVDRIVTIALLAYGLVNVVTSASSYFDLPALLNRSLVMFGADAEISNISQARTWGTIAAFVLIAGYAFTVLRAVRRMKSGRRSWWVPLVGAIVTTMLVAFCIMVPMWGDPAFMEALLSSSSTTP